MWAASNSVMLAPGMLLRTYPHLDRGAGVLLAAMIIVGALIDLMISR